MQDSVDPEPLEQLVFAQCTSFGLDGTAVKARLCGTLHEARSGPYFYEHLFMIGQQKFPFGKKKYWKWRKKLNKKMQEGKEFYYLGNSERFTCLYAKTETNGDSVCILDCIGYGG